jgi:probable HAF family extracellular repeat protein
LPVNIGDGINSQGIAVGSAGTGNISATSNNVAWIWDGRTYSFFTVPGSTGFGTTAGCINSPGQVVGYFEDASDMFHGFLKNGSTFTQIDVPGAIATFAYGINNRADVVGWYF